MKITLSLKAKLPKMGVCYREQGRSALLAYRRLLLKSASLFGLAAFALTGCMVGPDFKPLPPPKAEHYTRLPLPEKTVATNNKNAGKTQHFIAGRDLQGDWWQIFHSSSLNQLIAEGLNNNQDL